MIDPLKISLDTADRVGERLALSAAEGSRIPPQ
jgi:hypothetical protein